MKEFCDRKLRLKSNLNLKKKNLGWPTGRYKYFFIYHKNSIKGADDEHKYQYYKNNMEYNISG